MALPQLSPQTLQEVQALLTAAMSAAPGQLGQLPADFCAHWPQLKPVLTGLSLVPGPVGVAARAVLALGDAVCGGGP